MIYINILEIIGLAASTLAILSAVIIYFGKQFTTYFFGKSIERHKLELNKDLEQHKNGLTINIEEYKAKTNRILEAYKSELSLLQIKNSKLYDKQSQVVSDLFKLIIKVDRTFSDMTSYFHLVKGDAEVEESERINEAAAAYNEFVMFYHEHSIFFSEDLCQKIDKLSEIIKTVHFDYNSSKIFSHENFENKVKKIDSARENMQKVVPGILNQLRSDFRSILTVR